MNKYVLIPLDQYLSFKAFLAENRDPKYRQNQQETLNQSKSEKIKDNFLNVRAVENFEGQLKSIRSSINLEKSERNITDNSLKIIESTQSSASPYSKASEKLKHPIPPPGRLIKVEPNNVSYHSRIRKNKRNIQDGGGGAEWIEKWIKKF